MAIVPIPAFPPAVYAPVRRVSALQAAPAGPGVPPATSAALLPPALRPAVPLEALRGERERRFWGADGSPRLVPLTPFHAEGPPIVFVHGIAADPANEEVLIKEAQARGMQVYTMAYDTVDFGASQNAEGFEREFRALAGAGAQDLTIVAHSLGGMTTKACLDRMTDASGKLGGFQHVRFVALSSPWGGMSAANLALSVLVGDQRLQFARDLAPGSAYWQRVSHTPFSPQVDFYAASGGVDQFNVAAMGDRRMPENRDAVLAMAKRSVVVPNEGHNTLLMDPRTLAFVFDPEHAPDPASLPSPPLWKTAWREVLASIQFPGAFSGWGH